MVDLLLLMIIVTRCIDMALRSAPLLGAFIAYFGCTNKVCSSGKKIEIQFCSERIQHCNLNDITTNLKSFVDHFTQT